MTLASGGFIDAVIYPHIMRLAITEEELGDMRTFMEKVANDNMGVRHTATTGSV